MPKQNAPLLGFNRGIVSPKALARTDVERMAWSAEEQSNWKPSALGSMMLRPGLGYLLNTGANRPKYLPFVFRIDDTALLELTDGDLRVLVNDAALTFANVVAAVTNGDMSPDIASWTDADDSGAVSDYAATSGAVVALSARTVYDYAAGATATASYKLDNDGIVYTKRTVLDAGVYQAVSGEWKLSGAVADYEHRVTVVSGALTSGTTGSWLGGGTDREYTLARTTSGTSTVEMDVETRLVGGVNTLATARITLQATRTGSGGFGGGGGGGGIEP